MADELDEIDPQTLVEVTGGADGDGAPPERQPIYSNGNGALCRIGRKSKRFEDCRKPPT